MENTELSIIIPAYNAQSYIRRCVDSIMRQQDADRYEIIIVDDGSTDKTPKILDFIATKHKNIHVIHQKHAGVSVARNRGIEESHGKYVTFVDADDMVGLNLSAFNKYFSENSGLKIGELDTFTTPILDSIKPFDKQTDFDDMYFVNMLRVARQEYADVVLGGHIAIHYDTRWITRRTYDSASVRGPDAKYELLVETHARENANFALYTREMLDAHNLRFMTNMDLDEDILFCMLAVLYAQRVATAPNVTYFYNRHGGTLSNTSNEYVWQTKYKLAQRKKFSVLLNEIAKMPQYMIKDIFGYWAPFYINAAGIRGIDHNCHTCTQNDCINCPVVNPVLARCKQDIEKHL